jgi:hypothetical protein
MRYILIFVLLTVFDAKLFAQSATPSRMATENWIVEKLNKYVSKSNLECNKLFPGMDDSPIKNCLTYKNIRFSISRDTLLVSANVNDIEYKDKGKLESNFSRIIYVPLATLADTKTYISATSLFLITKFSSIIVKDDNGRSEKTSLLKLYISTDEEENFIERFDKAMNHLRSFIKSEKSKEAF